MTASRLAIVVAAILLLGVAEVGASELEGRAWSVAELGGRAVAGGGTLEIKGGAVSGQAACNRYRGSVKIETKEGGGTIAFGPLATTRMMCEGKMALEKALLDALAGARGFKREGANVVLTGADGGVLVKLTP